MNICPKKIKYYFLTTGSHPKRKKHILSIFKGFEITEIDSIIGANKNKSGTVGWCRMIDQGLRDKLSQPLVALEDDVSIHRDFPEILEIPDNADVLYVGISPWGRVGNKSKLQIFASDVNSSIVRRCLVESHFSGENWDRYFARIQPYYNVYALKNPLVYQDKEFGGQESTKFILSKYERPTGRHVDDVSIKMCNTKLNVAQKRGYRIK